MLKLKRCFIPHWVFLVLFAGLWLSGCGGDSSPESVLDPASANVTAESSYDGTLVDPQIAADATVVIPEYPQDEVLGNQEDAGDGDVVQPAPSEATAPTDTIEPTTPTPTEEVTSPSTETLLSLRIDPTFTVDSLPAETRLWYNRFLAGMRNPNQYPNATAAAQSNDTYKYGRTLNFNVTTILQMLRVTGDRQLLDEVDRLSQLMRVQLKDWSILTYGGSTYQADGYLNWQYNYDAGYIGTDAHVMDEMLAHSLVAAYAYAFYVNRDLDPRYAERAQFWTNYLKNDFEAKWRKRNNKPTGFPFMEKLLAHPYMQFVRYHYYMAKLTGDKAYEDEALRMAGNIKNQIKEVSTPIGTSAIWAHGMTLLGANSPGIQSTSYARVTVQGAADLAAEGFSIFGQAGYMDRIAVTLANNIMDGNLSAYAAYIDGSGSGGAGLDTYAISPWAMIGRWDKTGEVQVETDRVYRQFESSPENPKRIFLPAGMVYLLTR